MAALLLTVGGLYGYFGAATDPEWALTFIQDQRTPFADREVLLSSPKSDVRIDPILFVSNLVDSCAGAVAAPMSDVTRRELEQSAQRKRKA